MTESSSRSDSSGVAQKARGVDFYALGTAEVIDRLGVDPAQGLSSARVAQLLAANGPNALPVERREPGWRRFLDEYRSYMQVILVVAGAVSLVIGEIHTGVLLFVLTVINAVVGMREEGKAQSAMNALKSMLKSNARVRRDGVETVLSADQLVVGDVVLLAAGDQVPADGRLISASALQIDESALTGESTPAAKSVDAPAGSGLTPADQTDMAFMNTPVTHGSAEMVVTATGAETQVGRIAGMLATSKKQLTPLQGQLNRMTLWIGLAALATMVVMFALGLARGQDWRVLFVTAIALAVAAIPEALPTVVEVILSLGAVGLAKRNAIVKDLSSVETLGSTSAINSDKTGTLTMNQMTVVQVIDGTDRFDVTGTGYELAGSIHHTAGRSAAIDPAIAPLVVASDAKLEDGKVVGDPTEGAFLVLAHKAQLSVESTRTAFPRLATLPFDPTYKLMAVFATATDSAGKSVIRAFVKGAAPALLQRATTFLSLADEGSKPIDDDIRSRTEDEVTRMEGEGLRVMAAATKDLDPQDFDPEGDLLGYLTGLEVTCLVGMIDPPRDSSKAAVAAAKAAHIRVRMITGDDVTTGAAIAAQLGIPGEAVLGADFAALSDAERATRIEDIGVVGRVAPEHKALLVETLRAKGEVVAMTGDGVNDAPAIKAADIGIAMGTGTEVAKNAGRMILSDDNFATIVFAIEQGRALYDNLMKYVRFILITLVAFVLTFLGASLLNIAAGEPFTPAQILWMNFLVDAPLGIALGFDKETPGLMKRPPRSRTASILNVSTLVTSGLVGLFMGVCLLGLIWYGETRIHDTVVGVSMAITAFAMFRIVSTYHSRSTTGTVFSVATFDNRQMNLFVLGEIVLAWLVTQFGILAQLLGTTQLTSGQWLFCILPAAALLLLWNLGKWIARRLATRGTRQPLSNVSGSAAVSSH